ncbi:hypothetical protein AbraIFM66951_003848 [Aspergillus brasiliensis]|uniref:Zn(2)-C6 fungal-type domain-containing protein n=1 Tax=Aspergillus brasiliensis TaxID=319629 RepID=A0A9W5Z1M7_9EURO|nr:hypothetical protein AbraCBS73388_003256 [Aspergillus brasiliensis]GKZ50586.1 hypothetical protein AbraIFM66951_003848 [Aspergillus brasiliensis]
MPPSRRPRADPIVRVRTGCWSCRRRKKKCDEAKPVCGGCVRNKLTCRWPTIIPGQPKANNISFMPEEGDQENQPGGQEGPSRQMSTNREMSSSIESRSTSPSSPEEILRESDSPEDISRESPAAGSLTSMELAQIPAIGNSQVPGASATVSNLLPRSLSMFPGHGPDSYQLLSHYLATTADCMANGSTPINPFLVQIVPLAFSSDLLLQLVLTQSAAHRAFRSRKESDEVAQRHYTSALQLFRRGVTEFIDGKESNPLMLTTAKGDMNGTIFDHLTAANSLLIRLLSQSDTAVPKDLKDFVIEYYTYTAAVSMISVDARVSTQLFLNFDLEQRARQLLQSEYVGNLCGCWLELLLLIPCIFDLGRQWMMHDGRPAMPTADDIVMFSSLQVQIMQWTPYASVSPEVFLAGRIFQQAMLLYLYTALGGFSRAENGMYQGLIDTAITEAMSYLGQLSGTARINSGLCWPIAVVGSCLTNAEHQDSLRHRLTVMVNTFGLGNMQRTLLILEHMWQMPLDEAGPWNICRAMQQNQIWISFA